MSLSLPPIQLCCDILQLEHKVCISQRNLPDRLPDILLIKTRLAAIGKKITEEMSADIHDRYVALKNGVAGLEIRVSIAESQKEEDPRLQRWKTINNNLRRNGYNLPPALHTFLWKILPKRN